jgi:dihydroxy-acid dehydratase
VQSNSIERIAYRKEPAVTRSTPIIIDRHPGRTAQSIGIARQLGTDPDLIHEPSIGVVGTKGDSQCYLGVVAKVDAIHESLKSRIGRDAGQLKLRLVQPEYTIATSDGIRNGTREMRYSMIGREVTHDALCEHLSATGLAGTIAVVACDKPPVGALAALLEHNQPAIIMSDGAIHPGTDPATGGSHRYCAACGIHRNARALLKLGLNGWESRALRSSSVE